MSRLRLWVPATLLGLFAPVAAFADHCIKPAVPCPSCPAPAPKIIVEMSPPEVTFKVAELPAPKAPAKATAPSPAPKPTYAPAPAYAPPPMYYQQYSAVPVAAPMYAPMYAPPPPCGAPAAYGAYPQAAPNCGSSGYGLGPQAGLPSATDIRAFADALEAHERTAVQQQLSYIERQYNATATKAAAFGLRPAPLAAPSIPPAANSDGTKATIPPVSPSNEEVLREIESLKNEITRLKKLFLMHHDALEKKELIPRTSDK